MTAIDTNLVMRVVNNDEPAQAQRAIALMNAGPVFVPKSVVLESEWVLRSAYKLERKTIVRSLRAFLRLPQVTTEDEQIVQWALNAYAAGMDFADALHLASSSSARRFTTFDKNLRQQAATVHGCIPVVEP